MGKPEDLYAFTLKAVNEIKADHDKLKRAMPSRQPRRQVADSWPPQGIRFRNDSAEEVPGYAVMRITGVEMWGLMPIYTIGKPDSVANRDLLINGWRAIESGKMGYGTFCPAPVLYDTTNTPAAGETWGVKNAEWKLFKDRPGFTIRGGIVSGRVWTDFEGVNTLEGVLDADLLVSSTATVSVYANEIDTTDNITGVKCWMLQAGKFPSGTRVTLNWIGGRWRVVSHGC